VSEAIGPLTKIKIPTAPDACTDIELSPPAKAMLTPQMGVADFLSALIAAELWRDAVFLMARALPKREAVWWGCLAARSVTGAATPPPTVAALEAAEAWVFQPSEEKRRAAMERARATKFDHPGIWAAVGAFWSGGSMAPLNSPPVPPADHLTSVAIKGAVSLAAVAVEPQKAPEKYRHFLDQAIDIAKGGSGRRQAAG
jgi:hypothetical protein